MIFNIDSLSSYLGRLLIKLLIKLDIFTYVYLVLKEIINLVTKTVIHFYNWINNRKSFLFMGYRNGLSQLDWLENFLQICTGYSHSHNPHLPQIEYL